MKENIDFRKIKTSSLHDKKHKVNVGDLSKPLASGISFRDFFSSLPRILAGSDLREVVDAVVRARKQEKGVIMAMGAHVIKCGLSPLVIQLMEEKVLTAVAMNGAGIIHDFELAFQGSTSETVEDELGDGTFGMAEETGAFLNKAILKGVQAGQGIGEAVGTAMAESSLAHTEYSILTAGRRLGIPVTVHVAIGTDTIHFHPDVSGEALGSGSLRDFKRYAAALKALHNGGVYFNIGSAVVLPEVFLKALSLLRNLGHGMQNFTTVNLDFIQHYRPAENVLRRPVLGSGKGIALTGHHEILLPLLVAGILEALSVPA